MQHTIDLVVGDWSGDGHNQKQIFTIKSNLDNGAVAKAFKAGEKKLRFRFRDTVAVSYDDNKVPSDAIEKLKKHGLDLGAVIYDYMEGEQVTIGPDEYVDIWLFIAKLGNPSFEFELIDSPAINIGGYGLFT